MYYPGLVHETNTIKNAGAAPADRHKNPTLASHRRGRSAHDLPCCHTLSHSLAPFTALLSLSLSPSPLSLVVLVCATDPAHTHRKSWGCRC